jgi:hypothetical protein
MPRYKSPEGESWDLDPSDVAGAEAAGWKPEGGGSEVWQATRPGVRGLMKGATFGLNDVVGGIGAGLAGAVEAPWGKKMEGFKQGFGWGRQNETEADAKAQAESPWEFAGGNLVGAVATGGIAAKPAQMVAQGITRAAPAVASMGLPEVAAAIPAVSKYVAPAGTGALLGYGQGRDFDSAALGVVGGLGGQAIAEHVVPPLARAMNLNMAKLTNAPGALVNRELGGVRGMENMGETLMNEGIVGAQWSNPATWLRSLRSPESIAKVAQQRASTVGDKLDDIYARTQSAVEANGATGVGKFQYDPAATTHGYTVRRLDPAFKGGDPATIRAAQYGQRYAQEGEQALTNAHGPGLKSLEVGRKNLSDLGSTVSDMGGFAQPVPVNARGEALDDLWRAGRNQLLEKTQNAGQAFGVQGPEQLPALNRQVTDLLHAVTGSNVAAGRAAGYAQPTLRGLLMGNLTGPDGGVGGRAVKGEILRRLYQPALAEGSHAAHSIASGAAKTLPAGLPVADNALDQAAERRRKAKLGQ